VDGLLPELGLVALLVVVNAAFAGTELAVVSLREGQLHRLEQRSSTGAALARLARSPNQFLATIQVGITLAGFLASAVAAVSLARPLVGPLGFLGRAAEPVAVVVVTVALAYVTLVLGELAPKRVAMQRAERWALVAAKPLAGLSVAARPVVWLLSRSTDLAVRAVGADPSRNREQVTEEELRDMVAVQASFSDRQRLIIDGAFEIAERTLREVLRPRREVFVLDAQTPRRAALEELAATGYSRAPVGPDRALDGAVGVVHLRDLLGDGDRPVGDGAAELCALPETLPVLDALHELQSRRTQLAVVVDEHGSATGIVTVEDLVEELVGEIYDESDRDVIAVGHDPDGSVRVRGTFPIHDLTDLGVFDIPEGPYSTVAGLVLDRLGRLADGPGDHVVVAGWRFEVTAVERHAITGVRIGRAHSVPRPVALAGRRTRGGW
jgi:putative hemolysin